MSNFIITALLPIQKEYSYYVLPNRNFVLFNGKPMYQHMIEKLLKFPEFESIVISTNSDEVKEYCKRNGKLRIIDRPDSLTGEDVKSDMVTAHALEKISGEYFMEFQSFHPLLTHDSIEGFIKQYIDYIVPGEYFDSMYTIQRHELRNFDLDKRELNDEYQFVMYETGILHGFTRANFRKNGNQKVGKLPFHTDVKEIEGIPLISDENYELAKLVYDNRDKFPTIFRDGSK